jgi:signal peptidase II
LSDIFDGAASSAAKLWYFLITVAVIVVDQATKYWVATTLQSDGDIVVVRGLLNFSYTENRGIAFGMLNNGNVKWLLVTISIGAIVVVVYYMIRSASADRALYISLALLAGGIGGNLIDRMRMGRVIDFIELYYRNYHWPVFNIADTAISIGAVLLAIDLFLAPHSHNAPAGETAEVAGEPPAAG